MIQRKLVDGPGPTKQAKSGNVFRPRCRIFLVKNTFQDPLQLSVEIYVLQADANSEYLETAWKHGREATVTSRSILIHGRNEPAGVRKHRRR